MPRNIIFVIEEMLGASFHTQFLSYQRKVGNLFFQELPVFLLRNRSQILFKSKPECSCFFMVS
jgi:hypothetical protein